MLPTRRLLLIDAANSIYRAFFAIPHLRAPDGTPTNAVYGFANMLAKVLRDEAPDFVAVVFDPRGKTFRHRIFEGYKAGRDAQPEDLGAQFPIVRELVDALRVPIIEVPDYEADDVIATLVRAAPDDAAVTILSTDKDLMQLVSDRVSLLDGMKERRYGPTEVQERFGVEPEKILDLRSLVGDKSDNIPGVKGIGEKGAASLIEEWGSLENLLEHAADVKAKRARNALQEHAEDARLSKRLATLRSDLELPLSIDELAYREPDREALRTLYERLGFTRLLEAQDQTASDDTSRATAQSEGVETRRIADEADLAALVEGLAGEAPLHVLGVAGAGSAVEAPLVAVAIALAEAHAAFLPLAELRSVEGGLAFEAALGPLRELFWGADGEQPRRWSGIATKQLQSLFGERGLELPPPSFDLEVAAFLVDPAGSHAPAALSQQLLGARIASWEDLAGRGAKAIAAEDLPLESLEPWAGAQVCALARLEALLRERLEKDALHGLFEEVEMPLCAVLSRMERAGVRIDEERLAELSSQYEKELERLEGEIYELAGERFLVNSPKQLQKILFEKLKLPPIKKTKTGYSTAEDVLEQLAAQHALPARILAWRRLAKLKSTYVDALPPLVCEHSGRVHPVFHQNGAATGRMSASNPNVQNIPIRSEEGIRIREAFVPAEGCLLLSSDYSQVELRILAHYSGDESLIDAFTRGEDVHRRTAAEVAGIAAEEVSPEQRARAKAVNFGIIYGSSAFGLANQLGIATGEAQETIDAYFALYKGVRRFLDETIAEAKDRGFVSTLLGRRRYLPDLRSRNRVLRQAAERMAVNSVIQGTAADLIKRAMVDVDAALSKHGLRARMLLQVHDELVFEAPEAEVERLAELVRERMQDVFSLRVPLEVDIGTGRSWREAH